MRTQIFKKRSKVNIKEKLNIPAKASIIYTAIGVISRSASFLFTPFFTRIMTSAEFGSYSLLLSYISAATIIGSLEISGGVLYRLLRKNIGNEAQILSSSSILVIISTCTTLLIFVPLSQSFGINTFPGFYFTLIISALARVGINLFCSYSKYKYKYMTVSIIMLLESIVTPLVVILFFNSPITDNSRNLASIRAIITGVILLAIALPVYYKLIFRQNSTIKSIRSALWQIPKILKDALPMLPYYISMMVILQCDKTIIAKAFGEAALAKYGIAHALGSAVTMLLSGLSGIMSPWIMRKIKASHKDRLTKISGELMVIISLLSLSLLTISPEVMAYLAPADYGDSLRDVFPIALSAMPLFFSGLAVSASLEYHGTLGIVLSGAIPAVLSILTNILLTPRYGIFSSALILYFSYTLLMILSLINLKKKSDKHLINVNHYLLISLLSILLSITIYLFRYNMPARLVILIPLSITLLYRIYKCSSYIKEAGDTEGYDRIAL